MVRAGFRASLRTPMVLGPTRSIKGVSAVRRSFLLGESLPYAWGTLAERGLYEHVPFEPGVLFEDIYASADLVPRLSEVVLVEAGPYGYMRRVGSICNPTEPDEQLLRDNLAAIRHFEGAVGEWGEELAAYAPVKVAWLYSGLCTRTLVFGGRAVWGAYLGEARRFVRENRGALLRAVRKGWLSPRVTCGLVVRRRGSRRRGLRRGVCVGGCGVAGDWDSLVANVDLNPSITVFQGPEGPPRAFGFSTYSCLLIS